MKTTNNSLIPYFILREKNLSPSSKILYSELTAQCDKDGLCTLSKRDLAEALNFSYETIREAIKRLESHSFVIVEKEGVRLNLPKEKLNYILENRGER
jgi:DNA-binding GntR family transcriptional regulator